MLRSEDRKIFETFCQFIWFQGDPLPLILDVQDEIYTEQGITLDALRQLEAIGLVQLNSSGFIKRGFGKHTRLFYCGKPTKIGFLHDADNSLDLGHALLTDQGKGARLFSQESGDLILVFARQYATGSIDQLATGFDHLAVAVEDIRL